MDLLVFQRSTHSTAYWNKNSSKKRGKFYFQILGRLKHKNEKIANDEKEHLGIGILKELFNGKFPYQFKILETATAKGGDTSTNQILRFYDDLFLKIT